MTTGFYWDEKCFWHGGGNYAGTLPLGGYVQPLAAGGLPEDPEAKRRMVNLMRATGLWEELDPQSAPPATWEEMARVHPESYLREFREASNQGGGELGLRAPFAAGGFEIAALSAGLSVAALEGVLTGRHRNAYALSRPPGHHCLPEFPNGFCLLSNLGIAIESALAKGLAARVAVIDWDVHHGNGTEAIFYDRPEVLTISLHQERNYPLDTGGAEDRGSEEGLGANMNIPLPPGTGHKGYLEAMERLVLPAVEAFAPDIIVIACGYDAGANDPLGRMLATAETFSAMTRQVMAAAEALCGGRLMMAHEGGYSEVYVPFCGHAVLQEMAGSETSAGDPLGATFAARQPGAVFDGFVSDWIAGLKAGFDAP
ncbi:class II histone deacetylase [Alphaproteobacteria bacterium KMM 3653]|uniref:Class II histone deacetylase n=1 Tax=Harenicola maris TaxID=2841044 RepID=A0AAP2CQS9_9RHOB|nr:class II histone deacetylase [Harenicola maris]